MNILITGGASGLGQAITNSLIAQSENKVYFTYKNSIANAEKIEAKWPNATSLKCDFTKEEDLNKLLDKLPGLDLDVLIHNAYGGDVTPKHFHKIPTDLFLTDFRENIVPVIRLTQAIIKLFRKKKSGKIITILTSYLANVPPMGLAPYVANKAYLEKLTKVWANENAKFGISSNSISPSFMETGLTEDVDDRIKEQMVLAHPLKKLVTVEEVADSVKFLVNASNQINGVDLIMNAGVNVK